MLPEAFVTAIATAAQASSKKSGIPASFTIAEGALESGWGNHAPGNNLFGVKADASWTGAVTIEKTRECVNNQWVMVQAKFRAYPDWQGCMDDHAAFLTTNDRYAPAFQTSNVEDFTHAIAAAGYATDPNYANEILEIIRAHNLTEYDNV